ncbi:hypothetical protein ID866_6204 [Astraeus odoratus]|nr:hypothetical protein ID866_6204 [Astraeus odoratus]
MRLINVQSLLDFEEKDIIPQTKVVQNFSDESIGDTQYATISHCWCKTLGEELQFKEMDQLAGHDASKLRRRFGYKKIVESCLKARDDELEWLWVDPCCVAKVNIIELSEAINSMYRWFENSARCYAYLHDVDGSSLPIEADTRRFPDTNGWPAWFSCSWALPQLIAPKNVEFFNRNWDRIGEKEDLASTLARITQIPEDILAYGLPHPDDPCRPSVAQIMSWAADREGNQVEDRTYAITGLFGVHTPVKYGEKKGAFHHLQVSILKEYNDHSIFAWSSNRTLGFGSVLADDPNDFRDCGDLLRLDPLVAFVKECPDAETEIEDHETFQVTPGKGIEIWLPAVGWSSFSSHVQVKLACCREFGNGELITLDLAAVSSTDNTSFVREFEDIAPLPDQPRFQKLSLDLRDVRHIESYGSLKTSSSKV